MTAKVCKSVSLSYLLLVEITKINVNQEGRAPRNTEIEDVSFITIVIKYCCLNRIFQPHHILHLPLSC